MEKVKKYWKEILIGLLVIFCLNKCTTSCSRGRVIKKQNIEIVQKDSLIKVQSDSLNILKIRWIDAQTSQNAYQGIAMGNQQELVNQVNKLQSENDDLQVKNNGLLIENKKLKVEIKNLKSKINE